MQNTHPTCQIYPTAILSNTSLSLYNVIFDNVIIESSTVGSYSYIQKRSSIHNTDIGMFCSIASNVTIGPGIHKMDGISTHPSFYTFNTPLPKRFVISDLFLNSKRVSIGHDVWIGEKVIILDGLKIGTGAIIAAGAVVTKDVEPYAIVGGVPAKILKYRFEPQLIQQLLESCWWNQSEEWFKEHISIFSNPNDLINKTL